MKNILLIFAFCTAFRVCSALNDELCVVVPESTYTNQEFWVSVNLSNASRVYIEASVIVNYDAERLEYVASEAGNFFTDITSNTVIDTPQDSKVVFDVWGTQTVTGNGTLYKLKFKVKSCFGLVVPAYFSIQPHDIGTSGYYIGDNGLSVLYPFLNNCGQTSVTIYPVNPSSYPEVGKSGECAIDVS